MKRHKIIPIFIPHVGCTHDCVFCNQQKITGQLREDYEKITGEYVTSTIRKYLETIDREITQVEVSFFGGTFTSISLIKQKELLQAAKQAKDEGLVDRIRLSTRPDAITLGILNHLKRYDVDIVELGVQSMDNDVLSLSRRGYEAESVRLASRLIRRFGMTLGHQLMIGLPGDTEEKDLFSLEESIKEKPDMVRIYPALVIKDTEMETAYLKGDYRPYDLEDAVRITSHMIGRYEEEGITVIRAGLQPTEEINEGKDVLAGPFHPAFRELCDGYALARKIERVKADAVTVHIGKRDLSRLYAGGKRYFLPLLKDRKIRVLLEDERLPGIISVKEDQKRSV